MITAELGKTVFEIEDSTTPGVVKITRTNSDGAKEFFVPRTLIVKYTIQRLEKQLLPLLLKELL